MATKIHFEDLLMAIVFGVAIGMAVGFSAYGAGVPAKMVGPITGAVAAPLVGILYRIRTERRRRPPETGADG